MTPPTTSEAAPATDAGAESKPRRAPHLLLLDFFSSYGLSATLLLLLFLLTFLGTIAQVEHGLYQAQKKYFESLFLVHWLGGKVPLPLPGALLLMSLLSVNLILGGLVRIKWSKRTVGVIIVHVGMLVMLLAGLVKLTLSDDGHLTLYENQERNEYASYFLYEVAIYDADAQRDVKEWLIPEEQFKHLEGQQTARYTSSELPFDLTLAHFLPSCRPMPKGPNWTAKYPVIDGFALREVELNKEREINEAGIYATVHPKQAGAQVQTGILWSRDWPYPKDQNTALPLVVSAGGKRWAIDLRKKRYPMPYTVRLDKFTRELYPGTTMPKVFLSDVTRIEGGTEEKSKIEMNDPLRHGGLVLFQSAWGPPPAASMPGHPLYSTFSVVRNPSDYWPLYSCIIISIGLVIAFTQKLTAYVKSQAPKREA